MLNEYIRVAKGQAHVWTVLREPDAEHLLSLKIKSQAVAYARAIALSGKLTLFVDDARGIAIHQSADSLTYPTILH